ncbi:MAG: Hsp20/alpha crystallin family protein [Verrucomicrobia bacterium]|nr:Hsp20/alpha crystallin family protein [Verrucomicrobiota bacterium]MCH8512886.1 Hsp20/alpha crystallin family protein [Kiritimatiellia bacterium]
MTDKHEAPHRSESETSAATTVPPGATDVAAPQSGRLQKALPILLVALLLGFAVQSWFLFRISSQLHDGNTSREPADMETVDLTPPPQNREDTATQNQRPPPQESRQESRRESRPRSTAPQPGFIHPSPLWKMDEWNPFEEINRLREEMDNMFGRMYGGMHHRSEFDHFPRHILPRQPRLDIRELDDAYELTLELPGAGEQRVVTKVQNRHLHIRAEMSDNSESDPGGRLRHHERIQGSFHRVLPLPPDADGDAMESSYQDGLLKIILPKKGVSVQDTI